MKIKCIALSVIFSCGNAWCYSIDSPTDRPWYQMNIDNIANFEKEMEERACYLTPREPTCSILAQRISITQSWISYQHRPFELKSHTYFSDDVKKAARTLIRKRDQARIKLAEYSAKLEENSEYPERESDVFIKGKWESRTNCLEWTARDSARECSSVPAPR